MNTRPTIVTELPRFSSIEQLIEKTKPVHPTYVIHPERFRVAGQRFVDSFPGDTLYAVKANPHPLVLDQVWASGIRHFDTASLAEIELVRGRFPEAQCHFMAPVRLPGAAKVAFEKHNVTDYVIDCDFDARSVAGGNQAILRSFASSCASPRRLAARCLSFRANSARRPMMQRGF